MVTRKKSTSPSSVEEFGLKLLQSVREMKARNFARVTQVAQNEVVEARQGTGMSQAEFAAALSISKRSCKSGNRGAARPRARRRH